MHDESTEAWRLLLEPDADGATNMATDEALLDAYLTPDGCERPPTLRLYGWRPAALSLGRGQSAAAGHDPAFLSSAGLGLVRRPTGGQAVLHEGERTYSVTGRLDRPPFDAGVVETYRLISRALLRALERLGVARVRASERRATRPQGPVCFASSSTHEVQRDQRKLIGSAQMRRRQAFLQHGSIPLRAPAERLGNAIGSPADGTRFSDLVTALGREPTHEEVDRALIAGFAESFNVTLAPGRRSLWEEQRRERLRSWKYLSAAWTFNARLDPAARRYL